MILAICSTVAVLACHDELPTQAQTPAIPRPLFSLGAPDVPVQGCTKWKVTLTGGSGVTISVVSTPSCGPVPPILTAAATYDPATKIISLPIALKNNWTREVVAPARAFAWNDSIAIITPAGLTNGPSGTYIRLIQMDSTIASGATNLANARLWKYDTLLAAHATPQILNPGVTGRSRNVTMQIVSGAPTVFTVLLRVQAQNAYPVSLVPPDSQPAGLYADTNVLINNSYLGGKAVKNTILVLFTATATQAQRQAAIDSVKGVVVGGDQFLPNQDGYYLVRIANEATGSAMSAAIAKLQGLAQVDFAGTVDLSESHNGREPNDGSGWLRAQYSYKSSDGAGETWALKMINAPLAWGCDTGGVASKIAVVDNFFFSSTDISYANTNNDLTYWTADSAKEEAHGARISSVIGAIGNNGKGMTGVLWKSSLSHYDYLVSAKEHAHADYRNIARLIFQAGMDGAAVINLSQGIGWPYVPSDTRPADKFPVADRAKLLGKILARLEAQSPSRKPLIVLSAGNDQYDAKWNGWPSAKNSAYVSSAAIRSRILVASGVSKSGTAMWAQGSRGSNWGAYVDILAPAELVPSINGFDAVDASYSGTSYSAPFATGVAGLLSSFDSRLGADSLRTLIIQGAASGGRGISDGHGKTIYVLDAYEALKAAGARAHAPLCGNRVWGVDNIVATLRANNVTETLHTYPAAVGPIEHLQAAHGGHWLELNDPASGTPPYGQRFRLTFNPTDWTPTAGSCTNCPALSGSARSGDALDFGGEVHSHDGDSSIAWSVPTRPAYSSLPVTFNLLLKRSGGGGTTLITGMRDTVQDSTKQTFGNAPGALAYSPTGDFAVFSTYDHTVVGGWFDTNLFKITIPNGVVTPLLSLPSQDASWLSISEDGKELTVGSTYAGSCSIQYFSVATGAKFDWPYVFGTDTVGSTTNNAGYPTCFLGGSASASRGHMSAGPSLNRITAEPLASPPRRP